MYLPRGWSSLMTSFSQSNTICFHEFQSPQPIVRVAKAPQSTATFTLRQRYAHATFWLHFFIITPGYLNRSERLAHPPGENLWKSRTMTAEEGARNKDVAQKELKHTAGHRKQSIRNVLQPRSKKSKMSNPEKEPKKNGSDQRKHKLKTPTKNANVRGRGQTRE